MVILIAISILVCLLFPLGYAWRLWRLDEPTLGGWLIVAAEAAALVALVMIMGRWDIAGYYTRYLLLALFVAAIAGSAWRHRSRPFRVARSATLKRRWPHAISLLFFGGALVYLVSGLIAPSSGKALVFPLAHGRFMVGQGGGNPLLNHHSGHPEQRYAADITAIGSAGFRATGILPEELERYAIYGTIVVSPCTGTIIAAQDGLPDLVPPASDPEHPAGNHIVIDCGGVEVTLAHLQKGSVGPAAGERVRRRQPIAEVGNSGNTTEPHLHIHAVDKASGKGMPMFFKGEPPVRNRLFSR